MPQPDITQLADDIERVSYHGVGRALPLAEDDIPNLACAARKLTGDDTGPLRIVVASAVRDAVLRLDPPATAEAAANLLDFDLHTDDFSEDRTRKRRPLKHRYPHVAPLLGHKVSYYERRKLWRELYEQIAANLQSLVKPRSSTRETLRALPPAPGKPRSAAGQSHGVARVRSSQLANAAAGVYYACLGALFVAKLHNEFSDAPDLRDLRLLNWAGASEWLFSRYCVLLATYLTRTPDTTLSPLLADSVFSHLWWLRDLAEMCSPFDSTTQYHHALQHGVNIQYGLKTPLFRQQSLVLDYLYDEVWTGWYATAFTGISWPPRADESIAHEPLEVVLLAAISRNIVITIISQMDLGYSPLTESRRHAHHSLYTFYSVDEWRPLGNGGPLAGRVDAFFDGIDHRLAMDYGVCYDREEKKQELEEACQSIKDARSSN